MATKHIKQLLSDLRCIWIDDEQGTIPFKPEEARELMAELHDLLAESCVNIYLEKHHD